MTTIEELYTLYLQHPIVSTDTRKLPKDCLFFALKGANFDGNKYALSALEAGAAYAVIDDCTLVDKDDRLLLVPDVLYALQQLARHHRHQLKTPVIAITGTNGKTTTKELTASVLAQGYQLLFTEGNLNNHIGVPLTLLRLTQKHQLALIEMGASKPGDIAELCAIAEPNYGLITNIGQAHLEGFGSIEGVRKTKGELYNYVRTHGGVLFVHAEDTTLLQMSEGVQRVLYGTKRLHQSSRGNIPLVQGEVKAVEHQLFLSFSWSCPSLSLPEQEVTTDLVGAYNLPNALAAITFGLFFDIPVEKISEALRAYTPSNSRSQFILSDRGNRIIADAYNANPSSMKKAIENFLSILPLDTPRTLILGDMNELGTASEDAHRQLLEMLRNEAMKHPLEFLLCGPKWQALLGCEPNIFPSVSELKDYLMAHPLNDTLILLKGSNSIHLSELLPLL